jgi:ABC-2 type transport system permease protein
MRYVMLHAGLHLRTTLRMPAYWVPSLCFPLLFFFLFGYTGARRLADQGLGSEFVITPFLLFTTLNVTMVALAAGVAGDRESPWEDRMRLLPVPTGVRFAGRLVYVLAFNVVSWIPLLVVATLVTDLRLPLLNWPTWLGSVLLGAAPFALLGIAIGYRLPAQAAMMTSNLLYLVLSFLGGLFLPTAQLPAVVRAVQPYVPTSEYLHLVLAAMGRADQATAPTWTIGLLLAWGLVFALLARAAFRRDEGTRY